MERPNTLRARWAYAAKPASWPKLFSVAAAGHLLGVAGAPATDPGDAAAYAAFGLAFTTLDVLAIVFLNDWGDREVDAIKRRMFPDGCSPKTIPDRILPAPALLRAGLACVAGLLVTCWIAGAALDRPHLLALGALAAGTFQVYTFAPLRLNYRGGGELVEMLGVGGVLPWIGIYVWTGDLAHPLCAGLGGTLALALSSALASGLSDEESDRAGGKRTFTTMLGNERVRRACLACLPVACAAWIVAASLTAEISWIAATAGSAVVLAHGAVARTLARAATTNAFSAQARFKHRLHLSIWWGTLAFAVSQALCSHLIEHA